MTLGRALLAFTGLVLTVTVITAGAVAAPRIVVSVKPVHALVAGVAAGVAQPQLLVESLASPHSYALRPSDAQALSQADLVVWVGPELEGFLVRPLATLAAGARVVTLLEAPGVKALALDAHGRDAHAAPAAHGARDPHIWLSPSNAKAIVAALAETLAEMDPGNREHYGGNARRLLTRIDALDDELRQLLAPVTKSAFITAHEAFAYFARHYTLTAAAAVALSPDRQPGAAHIRALQDVVRDRDARCLFTEPQIESPVARRVAADLGLRVGILDPLGADVPADSEAWFAIMRRIGTALVSCLGND